jgi:uncharacterized protein YecT (DUF1311 family)
VRCERCWLFGRQPHCCADVARSRGGVEHEEAAVPADLSPAGFGSTVPVAVTVNTRINKQIRAIWTRLGDAVGRGFFARAERAWRVYVRNACTSQSRAWVTPASPHQYVGGTMATLSSVECEEDLTKNHLRELTAIAKALAPR